MPRVVQPEEFHGLRTEDAEDWLDNFNNVADANRWNANRRLAIVPVFLKGAAARWYKNQINGGNLAMWNGGAGSFEYEFLDKFISETKRANW